MWGLQSQEAETGLLRSKPREGTNDFRVQGVRVWGFRVIAFAA